MRKLLLDTSFVTLTVGRGWMPKRMPDGEQKTERGTGRPLNTVQLIADTGDETEDAAMFLVTVPIENPPKLAKGTVVEVEGLEAIPWVNKAGAAQVAFRATSIKTVTSAKSSGSSSAASSAA